MKLRDNNSTVECIFITVPSGDQIQQICDLYRAQGWWEPQDEGREKLITRLITGSHCFAIATDGRCILGMGRAISDGVSDAYIQDLTVRKDNRKMGIGRKILLTIINRLHDDGIPWIGLIAEPGSFNLYHQAGFHEMQNSVAMLMINEL
jgi:aralkylamine N-acetyltransferase